MSLIIFWRRRHQLDFPYLTIFLSLWLLDTLGDDLSIGEPIWSHLDFGHIALNLKLLLADYGGILEKAAALEVADDLGCFFDVNGFVKSIYQLLVFWHITLVVYG